MNRISVGDYAAWLEKCIEAKKLEIKQELRRPHTDESGRYVNHMQDELMDLRTAYHAVFDYMRSTGNS